MNLAKWRIRKRDGVWHVHRPGRRYESFPADSFTDAVRLLIWAQRWSERGF